MRGGYCFAVTILIAKVAGATGAAPAPAPDAAEVFVKRGIELRKGFKDLEALEQFQRAYQLARTPRILAQMGAAEQALGRWVDAESHVSNALGATTDVWVSKNRPVLEEALATIRRHIGKLEIIASPPGAAIWIDGRQVGRAPLQAPLRVSAGSLVVEIRAPGFFPATRMVLITAEQLTRETVALSPSAGSASPDKSVNNSDPLTASDTARSASTAMSPEPLNEVPSGAMVPTPVPVARTADDAGERNRGSWRRPVAWTLAVGAVAFAGGGVAALLIRDSKATDYNRLIDSSGCAGSSASACAQLRSDGNLAGTFAVVGFGIAGAMALTSAILFLTEPSPQAPSLTAMRACDVDWRVRGILCGGSF